jgi:hypothetical protein
MFKPIEKFFRSIITQAPPLWQELEENNEERIDNHANAIKENIFRSFAKGWIKEIACDKGWLELIADCHSELLSIDPNYKILQIKEKFGTLRFYAEPSTTEHFEKFRLIIDKYEQLSAQTCEMTGMKGVLMKRDGWYKTLEPKLGFVLGYQETKR